MKLLITILLFTYFVYLFSTMHLKCYNVYYYLPIKQLWVSCNAINNSIKHWALKVKMLKLTTDRINKTNLLVGSFLNLLATCKMGLPYCGSRLGRRLVKLISLDGMVSIYIVLTVSKYVRSKFNILIFCWIMEKMWSLGVKSNLMAHHKSTQFTLKFSFFYHLSEKFGMISSVLSI